MIIIYFKKIFKSTRGISLAEVLVTIGILSILLLAVYSLIQFVLKITSENKLRLGAIMVADLKMEKIKNLPYAEVGTLTGIVHGSIPDNEVIEENNGIFYVNTLVQYIDDPFDGVLGGLPEDLLPTDYKQVRARVRWFGRFGQKEVTVYTKIAPKGMETGVDGGILSINVFNASGQPTNLADIHLENNNLDPVINLDAQTNSNGRLDFPGAPESIEGYDITVTKPGYSTSSTTPRTVANPNPTLPPATVLNGQRTEMSFSIDLLSNITIKTVKQNLPNNWRVNSDSSTENQTNSRIAADASGNLYITWQDFRSSSGSKIYAQKYNTSGQRQWSLDDVVIGSANNQILPDIKVSTTTGNVYIGWNDDSNGNQDAYLVKRSPINGDDLWTGAKKITTAADSDDQTHLRLALYDKNNNTFITVVWQDNRDDNLDVYLQRYGDNKNNVFANEIKINKNGTDNSDQYEPAVAIDQDDNIYAVWTDKRSGNEDIYAAKYDSSGNPSWADDIKINSNAGTSIRNSPAVLVDHNGVIYYVWADERNGNSDIYLAKYNSSGQPIWTPKNIMVNSSANSNQYHPSIAIDADNNLYISWTDERNGNQDIYAQKIDSYGNRLWPDDLRVNINLGATSQLNSYLTLNLSDNKAYATWQDDRNGNFDIYASRVDGYGAINNIADVPLTITGAKQIGNNPIIYKYQKTLKTNSTGELTIPNIEWDSYNINLTDGYSAYDIIMTSPEEPINLAPNTNLEVIIYLDN